MLYTYQRAAGLGQVQAQVNMGWFCLIGFGMETNHSEAFKWFEKAANAVIDYHTPLWYVDRMAVEQKITEKI